MGDRRMGGHSLPSCWGPGRGGTRSGAAAFSRPCSLGECSTDPELPTQPQLWSCQRPLRISFLCQSPEPFLTLLPRLLGQVRRPGRHTTVHRAGSQPKCAQTRCLGSQGNGFKLKPSDISHESAPRPGTRAPPDTLGLFWVAEAGPRASGKCLESRSRETGVFPSPWGGQSSEGLSQPLLLGLWTRPHQSQREDPGESW